MLRVEPVGNVASLVDLATLMGMSAPKVRHGLGEPFGTGHDEEVTALRRRPRSTGYRAGPARYRCSLWPPQAPRGCFSPKTSMPTAPIINRRSSRCSPSIWIAMMSCSDRSDPIQFEMRLVRALKRRETADFERTLQTCAGTRASGRRTARPNCRVATSSPSGSRPTDRESRQRQSLPNWQRHILTRRLVADTRAINFDLAPMDELAEPHR